MEATAPLPIPVPAELLERLRSVGYLRRGEPFEVAPIDERVFERLCELTQDPWSPLPVTAGFHECDLCQFTGQSTETYQPIKPSGMLSGAAYKISATSSMSIAIPGSGVVFVAPTNITHYINAHGYCPPTDFCDAVLACPPMRSMAYKKAVLANGGRELLRHVRNVE